MLLIIKVYNLFGKKYKTIKKYQEYKDTIMFFKYILKKKNDGLTKVKINYNYLSKIGRA